MRRNDGDVQAHDEMLRELRTRGLGDLLYPVREGCAGSRASGGAPSPCQARVSLAAWRWYPMPRPGQWVRVFVCDGHAVLVDEPGPLTDGDRRTLVAREREAAYWRGVLERQRARARPS